MNNAATGATVRQLANRVPFSEYQVIAAIIWVVGCLATAFFVAVLGCPEPYNFLLAIPLQWMFTRLQAPVWRRQVNVVSLLFLAFDVLINTGGLFFIVGRLDQTQAWSALYEVGAVDRAMSSGIAFGLALVLGIAIAAAPEKIWKWR